MGHEIVGIVEETGETVENLKKGDLVGVGWNYNSCLECARCIDGEENLCVKKEATGYTKDGGYSEYVLLDSVFVSEVPKNIKPENCAPLFCAGLTAYGSVKKLQIEKNDRIGIVGIGGLGSYAIQFAKMEGAAVIAFSREPGHLELARKMGADEVVDSSDDLASKIRKANLDAAIVFAPSAKVLEDVLTGIRKGATVVMGGNIEKTTEMNFRSALAGEKVLTTVSTGTREDMREILDMASKGKLKTVVHTMKLSEANDALIRVKSSGSDGRIVLVP
jgi:propanol-preferring alcohol dehydrogenase